MKNVLFIVVPLCIRLVSGFIVPSGISEFLDNDILSENGFKVKEGKKAFATSGTRFTISQFKTRKPRINHINLDKLQTKVKEMPLKEHMNGKGSNVDERSFVFIDTKYKVPFRNQMNNNLPKEKEYFVENNNNKYKTFVSNLGTLNSIPFDDTYSKEDVDTVEKDNKKSYYVQLQKQNMNPGVNKEAYDMKLRIQVANNLMHQRYSNNNAIKQAVIDNSRDFRHRFLSNHIDRNHQKYDVGTGNKKSTTEPNERKFKIQDHAFVNHRNRNNINKLKGIVSHKAADEHREYVELLKVPIVRPDIKDVDDEEKNNVNDSSYFDDSMNNCANKNNDVEGNNKFNGNYFLPSYGIQGQDLTDNNLDDKLAETSINGQLTSDGVVERAAVDSTEEKALDIFFKTLTEHAEDENTKPKLFKPQYRINAEKKHTPCTRSKSSGKQNGNMSVKCKCRHNHRASKVAHTPEVSRQKIKSPIQLTTDRDDDDFEEIFNKKL